MANELEALNKAFRKSMRNWLVEAARRNSVNEDGYVWCPVRVGEIRRRNSAGQRSLWQFLWDVYLPGIEGELGVYLVITPAAKVLASHRNRPLQNEVDSQLRAMHADYVKRKKQGKLLADDYLWEGWEDTPQKEREEMILLQLQTDRLHLSDSYESLYVYVPVWIPPEADGSQGRLSRNQGNAGSNTLAGSKYSTVLYLDVGAWSSPQSEGQGHAPFGIITPDEVCLWDILATRGQIREGKGLAEGGMVKSFYEKFHHVLGGQITFYAHVPSSKKVQCIDSWNNVRRGYSFGAIRRPFTDNRMLVVIPDLHLHMFPGFGADNFIEPWADKQSLMYCMRGLLDYLGQAAGDPYPIDLVQVGDLYELWESAILMAFAREPRFLKLLTSLGFESMLAEEYRDQIRAEVQKRGYNKLFTDADIEPLTREPWIPWRDLKNLPTWQKMKRAIQNAHSLKDSSGQEGGLFTGAGKIHIDPNMTWTYIAGNHDSFVGKETPQEMGANGAIWVEHGHLKDPYNCPEKMSSGVFFTGANLVAEIKNVGDPIKGLESCRRGNFVMNAATIAWDRVYRRRQRPYSLIVTGHTHRAYAALLTVQKDAPDGFTVDQVLYDQGWETLDIKDYLKRLPAIIRTADRLLLRVARMLAPAIPALSLPLNLAVGCSRRAPRKQTGN